MTAGLLEITVLSLMRKREYFLRYHAMLTNNFFTSVESRVIYKKIQEYHDKTKGMFLRADSLWLMLEKYIDEDDHTLYRNLCVKIKKVRPEDIQVAEHVIRKFAQGHLTKVMLQQMSMKLQANQDIDPRELQAHVDGIMLLNGIKKEVDYDYMGAYAERVEEDISYGRIPTGISQELDMAMSGGLGQGELGFFLGPPKRGKTLTLVNVGANALRQGKRVLHATLEIQAKAVARRYDSCLARATWMDLKDNPEVVHEMHQALKEAGGDLTIKDYSYMQCTVGQLHAFLEERRNASKPFDLVIVDFADLLTPSSRNKDSRQEFIRNYKELRILAGENKLPIWTASQANRNAMGKTKVGLEDIAEAFDKAGIADVVISLSQTDEEAEENEMRLFIAASRIGPKGKLVRCRCDTDRMLLEGEDAAYRSSGPRFKTIRRSANKPGLELLQGKGVVSPKESGR